MERLRGVAGRLARENALRNPSRTAVTAAALMIGLALVTFVSILAAGVKASIDDTISNDMKAQIVVQNQDGFSPISPQTGDALKKVPGVQTVSPLNTSQAEGGRGQRQAVRERDRPRHVRQGLGPEHRQGSAQRDLDARPARHPAREGLCRRPTASTLGDTVRATTPVGNKLDLRVRGTFDDKAGLVGDFAVTEQTDRAGTSASGTTSWSSSPCSREQTRRRSSHGSTGCWKQRFPIAEAQSQKEFQDSITGTSISSCS